MVDLRRGEIHNTELAYSKFDKVVKATSLSEALNGFSNSDEQILFEIDSTKGISSDLVRSLPNNISIRVIGGYTEEYMRGMKSPDLTTIFSKITYSVDELTAIIDVIEKMENGINQGWDDYKKSLYIYEYMKKNIIYRVPKEVEGIYGVGVNNRGRNWDSLIGLTDRLSTCNGFSSIYQELLTRQGINCTHIGGYYNSSQHAWDVVTIDNHSFLVDIIWDAIAFEKGIDQTTGFGISDLSPYSFKNNRELRPELSSIDQQWISKTLSEFDSDAKVR